MPETTPHPRQAGQQRSEHHAEHSGRAQSHTDGSGRPVRQFRLNRRERIGNTIVSLLARAGIGPIWLLTTRGRKTSRPRTNPVVPVEQDGRLWLVAPYGAVSWVHNARAAGRVTPATRPRHPVTMSSVKFDPRKPRPSSSATSASPWPPDRTSRRARTPRWSPSSPRLQHRPVFELTPTRPRTRHNDPLTVAIRGSSGRPSAEAGLGRDYNLTKRASDILDLERSLSAAVPLACRVVTP